MKKLTLFILLLVVNYSFSQVDCLTKFGMKAKPEINECEAAKSGNSGISQGYLECVCQNRKNNESNNNNEKDDNDTSIRDAYIQNMNQYDSMLAKAQNMQSSNKANSQEYKDLIKEMRTYEAVLNVPRHQHFDNPGFLNENTGNRDLDITYKNINDTKESIDKFTSNLSDLVGSAISARADRISLEDRKKSIKRYQKDNIDSQKRLLENMQKVYREKVMLNTIKRFENQANEKFNSYSNAKQTEIIENASKYINYSNCPNPVCSYGDRTEIIPEVKTCNVCRGEKRLHNHGSGGGYLNGPKNFMSCVKCLGKGTIIELDYKRETCSMCKGENKIFEYVGSNFLPYEKTIDVFKAKENEINQFKNLRIKFLSNKDIEFLPIIDNFKKVGFVNRNLDIIIKPIYTNGGLVDIDKARVSDGDKFGLINSKNKVLLPFEYDKIFNRNDTLILYKNDKIFTSKLDGTNAIEKERFVEREFKNKSDKVLYKLIRINGVLTFTDSENQVISNDVELVEFKLDYSSTSIYKLGMPDSTFKLFDYYSNTLSPMTYDKYAINTEKECGIFTLHNDNFQGFFYRYYDGDKNKFVSYFSKLEFYDLKVISTNDNILIKTKVSESEEKFGVIDGTGKWILEPIYDYIFLEKIDYKTTLIARKYGDKKRKASRFNKKGVFIEKVKLPK